MSSSIRARKRYFVDPKVQGALVARVMLYWVVCLVTITLMLLCWQIFTGPARMFYTHFDDMWFHFGPALVASFLLLPLVVIDIIRLSNRFVGPLVRLRRAMRALARGEHVQPIKFREGDFWRDFADEFNAVAVRVQGPASARAPRKGTAEDSAEETPEDEPVGTATDATAEHQ